MSLSRNCIVLYYGGGVAVERYYLNYTSISSEEQKAYYDSIKIFLNKLVKEYCGFRDWYNNLFVSGYNLKCSREIILCISHFQIAGIIILKKTVTERKICTLRVKDEFQHHGIGRALIEKGLEWLNCEKPLVTVRKAKEKEFLPLFNYYGFCLEETKWNYYKPFCTELVFNGSLPDRTVAGFVSKVFCDYIIKLAVPNGYSYSSTKNILVPKSILLSLYDNKLPILR